MHLLSSLLSILAFAVDAEADAAASGRRDDDDTAGPATIMIDRPGPDQERRHYHRVGIDEDLWPPRRGRPT